MQTQDIIGGQYNAFVVPINILCVVRNDQKKKQLRHRGSFREYLSNSYAHICTHGSPTIGTYISLHCFIYIKLST